jgi:hypothetical protein
LVQTRQIAQATKDIEATISKELWDRKRQWELKRDTLLDFARSMQYFDYAIMNLSIKIKSRNASPQENEGFKRALSAWEDASGQFEKTISMALLVVDSATRSALHELTKEMRDVSGEILQQGKPDAYSDHHRNLVMKLEEIRKMIRRELGIEPNPTNEK